MYKVFFWLEIQRPLAAKGLPFYEIIFYSKERAIIYSLICKLTWPVHAVLTGMLYLSVGICVWVAWCFKNDNFPFLWPIKFVRVVVSIFFGTFYIASINIFLTAAECVPPHHTNEAIYVNETGNFTDTAGAAPSTSPILVHHLWGYGKHIASSAFAVVLL